MFLLDTNTNELYARIFDTGPVDDNVPSKEIRFGYTISLIVLMTNFECCAVYSLKMLITFSYMLFCCSCVACSSDLPAILNT